MVEHLALIQKVAGPSPACPVYLRKKDMEMQSDNLESDPFKPQGNGLDFTQRKITYDIKSYINGYRELFTERKEAFC